MTRDEQTDEMARVMLGVIGREWLAARGIIAAFLAELRPDLTAAEHDHNAAAIIARLAHHKPPILIQFADED